MKAESLDSIYDRYALVGLDLHLRWGSKLQKMGLNDRWYSEISTGKLTFYEVGSGQPKTFDMEVLGSASGVNETWLWIWANQSVHPKSCAIAEQLKAIGEQYGITELSEPQSELDQLHFYTVGMIASGVTGKPFHIVPTGSGGCMVLIITEDVDLPPVDESKPLAMDIFRVYQQAQSLVPKPVTHHRNALVGLCESKGVEVFWAPAKGRPWSIAEDALKGGIIQAQSGSAPLFDATFDNLNRLTDFSYELGAASTQYEPGAASTQYEL